MSHPTLHYVVAIDGPAGAGKGTVARLLADRLGYLYVDTGALYRSVALLAKRQGITWDNEPLLAQIAKEMIPQFQHNPDGTTHLYINGEDVTTAIRMPDISQGASLIARWVPVVEALIEQERHFRTVDNLVMEGRNITTAVFPDAEVKIFLTATPEVRAERRVKQHEAKGETLDYATTLEEIKERDQRDTSRDHWPLVLAEDAIEVLTDNKTIEEVVDELEKIVRSKISS